MKSNRRTIIAGALLMGAGAAYAQFGSLGGMLGGGSSKDSGGDVSADVTSFITKSAFLSGLVANALAAINSAFSSAEQIAMKRAALEAIDKLIDPKEQNAKRATLYESEAAEAKRRYESGDMEKSIGGLDQQKKALVGAALLNFGIAALQAVDLSKTGQSLVQRASSSPMNVPKVIPVKDALPLLGKVASDSGGFIGGIIKLARGANITVPEAKVDSKPAVIEIG